MNLFAARREVVDDMSPQDFVSDATLAAMSGRALSRLAFTRSSNPDVLHFAENMIRHHGESIQNLSAIAAKEGLVVPSVPGSQQIAAMKALDRLSGFEFDRAYARQMTDALPASIAIFTFAAWNADRTLAHFARETLPAIRQQKVMAGRLNARLK